MSARDYMKYNRAVDSTDAAIVRSRALAVRDPAQPLSIIDPVVDERWARLNINTRAPKSYYDYYFSGQDIRVYVAEVPETDPDFGILPIVGLGYNVQQQKTPVYGYWNYTYNAVMRGTRIVSGSFALATRYPNYMRDLLATAAKNRASNQNRLADRYPSSQLTKDDALIEQYWGKHATDHRSRQAGDSEWSIHPPFSFVILYGVQDTSVAPRDLEQHYGIYENDNALISDHNQRLVEAYDRNQPNKIVLDACELTAVQRQYTPEGAVLVETYEFFARDHVVVKR